MTTLKQLTITLVGLAAAGSTMAQALPGGPPGTVPEPGVLALIAAGVGAVYLLRRK